MDNIRFLKNILTTFSTQIISVILGTIATIIIARSLGPSGKGVYTIVTLIPSLLVLVGNLGIGVANTYFCGSKKYSTNKLASNSVISAFGIGIILALGFFIFNYFYHLSFIQNYNPLYFYIALSTLPFCLVNTYLRHILLGEQKINQYNLLSISQSFLSTIILVILITIFFKLNLLVAIIAWVASYIINGIISIIIINSYTKIKLSFYPQIFKESVAFGIKANLANIITFLNFRLDMFLVASLIIDAAAVGFYSTAVAIAELLWLFPAAVGTIIFARTPTLTTEKLNVSTPIVCRNTLFIVILSAIIIFFLGEYIITILFGIAFMPATQPLRILLPGIIALSATNVLMNEVAGRGRPILMLIPTSINLIINISLNLLLIPHMGINGAALASTISYTVHAVIGVTIFLRISKNNLLNTIILKRQDLNIYHELFNSIKNVRYSAILKMLRS